jgi:hypothetical protein
MGQHIQCDPVGQLHSETLLAAPPERQAGSSSRSVGRQGVDGIGAAELQHR